jgi:4-diphosphocytidyl-2-C-methyl-D-erythritol kinase
MQVFAPAKINLSLRILSRRSDGFHEIETFIAPISLCDELKIERGGKGIDFTCNDPALPGGNENLVVRAAKSFFKATGLEASVSIELRKKIPHGAGLGGGSSDAATTLLALNELFKTNVPRETLANLSAAIGSDVPFFIFGSAAICRGRGEVVAPQKLHNVFPILLLKPEFGIPTSWAYSSWQGSREIPNVRYEAQEFHRHGVVNNLERPVFEKFVFLARLKMWLLLQPEVNVALMSGSGATVFAILNETGDGNQLAQRAKEELDPKLWTCVCETR